MNDRHQSYGLLLESAEPLDWNRTELKLLVCQPALISIEEVDNLVKIIDGSVENIGHSTRNSHLLLIISGLIF